jgi:putative sigma-54 modulation protein
MQFSVTFRHMDATEALKNYAKERFERIKKYFPDPIACHVVLSTERYNHRVDVNLQLHNGFKIAGHEITENMYSSIDLVSAKIERQARRYKDKLREHKTRDLEPLEIVHTVLSEQTIEPEEATDAEASGDHLIIKRENVHAQPMTVSEAIMQLNLLHEQFHVFLNDQTRQVNVVYRREDGAYGLIEPPAG